MKYQRTEIVDAEQVIFSEADKASAIKGIPVYAHGSTIRHDSFTGEFAVLVKKIGKVAQEGDWLVTDSKGFTSVVSAAGFKEYTAVEEASAGEEQTTAEVDTPVEEPQIATEPAAETPAAEQTHEEP